MSHKSTLFVSVREMVFDLNFLSIEKFCAIHSVILVTFLTLRFQVVAGVRAVIIC